MNQNAQAVNETPATFDDSFTNELGQNRLSESSHLRGRTLRFYFQENPAQVSFDNQGGARWQGLPLDAELAQGEGAVNVVEAAPELYFIELSLPASSLQSGILIVDERLGHVELVQTRVVPGRKQDGHATNIVQTLHQGRMDGVNIDSPTPHITDELIGKRALSIYSPNLAVEHIYINSQWYTYHIIGGDRHGDCDCDEATFYKLRDEIYLVLFREKAVDVGIIFVFDTKVWHSTGMAVGMVNKSGRFNSAPIGARMQLLSHTRYPAGHTPK